MNNNIDELIQGYSDWIFQECWNDRVPYYISIMFHPLHGSSRTISCLKCKMLFTIISTQLCVSVLLNTLVEKAKNTSCHALCSFLTCQSGNGNETKTSGRTINQNGGLHLNGVILVPAKSRLREDFVTHINRRQDLYVDHTVNDRSLYDRGGIERVYVKPTDLNHYNVIDYSLKTVKAGKVDYDTTIILPRTRKEMRPNIPVIDARARAIKDIQAATNVSDDEAKRVYNDLCGE